MKAITTLGQIRNKVDAIDRKYRKYSTKAEKLHNFFHPRQWNGIDSFCVDVSYNEGFHDVDITIFNSQSGHFIETITL